MPRELLKASQVSRLLGVKGKHRDGGGLYLHVHKAGQASWCYQFRLGGRTLWGTIGPASLYPLAEARAKHEEYRSYADPEAALTLFSGWTGVDFSRYRPDEELRAIDTEAMRSSLASFTSDDPNRVLTVRELAEHVAIGGRGPLFVGSPEQIADTLMEWVEATDVDGFNLAYAVTPESFEDFVELVVPELQRRGVYKREYRPGTLREKLFGAGHARLAPPHPAAGGDRRQPLARPRAQ